MTKGLMEIINKYSKNQIDKLVFYPKDNLDLLSKVMTTRYTSVVIPRDLAQPIYNAIDNVISESDRHENFVSL